MKNLFKSKGKRLLAVVLCFIMLLGVMPTTVFAATGDAGTISFALTYDSSGNVMRYNSSAVINGYTAGGTGNYKYRMYVDGDTAFCIQPGAPLHTGDTLKESSSATWNALSSNQKKAIGLALLYGYQGNRNNLTGSDDEKWLATQTLIWEFATGCRAATGSYQRTSTTVYQLHFGSNYANSGARAAYDQIVAMLTEHNTIPSFMSESTTGITKEMAYSGGKYTITLTDSNGVLSDYTFSCSNSNVSITKSGNQLTISSTVAIDGSVRITATRNNVPTVSESAKLLAYGDDSLQDVVTGVENADSVAAYINIETPTGTLSLKKTSEDGVVSGIQFTITGDNYEKTVTTESDGTISVDGLFPGTYTVTEASYDRYVPLKSQTVTIYRGDELIDTYTTDANGQFTTSYYIFGDDWSVREITPSEGYLLNTESYHIGAEAKNYTVEYNSTSNGVTEQVIKGNIAIIKHSDDGSTQIETPEEGAVFEVFLKSAGSYDNAAETKCDILTCDENGFAQTKDLPYGIYTVRQTSGWEGRELIADFDVYISENGETYRYLITPQTLEYGTGYTLVEVQAPYGYVLDSTPISFDVVQSDVAEESGITVIEVVKTDMPQKGTITVVKTGEVFSTVTETDGVYQPGYSIEGLEGAVYEITAAEDIYTLDGTLRASDGEVVDTITTDSGGLATSKELHLGSYTVTEITAPDGMVLNSEPHTVELTYAGQEVEVTSVSTVFYNERQKVEISLNKVLEQDEAFGIGMNGEIQSVQFGLYAAEGLTAADGTTIPTDGLIEIISVDENGHGSFSFADVPYGDWIIREIEAPTGYVLNEEPYHITISEDEQVIEIELENTLIRGSVRVIKTDTRGNRLSGATFGLYSSDGELIQEFTIPESGEYTIENLLYGDYYLLELEAPEGYELNEDKYEFSITEDGAVIQITVENEKTPVKETTPSGSTPKTGDDSNIGLWIVLAGIAAVGVATFGIMNRRKKKKAEENELEG